MSDYDEYIQSLLSLDVLCLNWNLFRLDLGWLLLLLWLLLNSFLVLLWLRWDSVLWLRLLLRLWLARFTSESIVCLRGSVLANLFYYRHNKFVDTTCRYQQNKHG